MPIEPAKKRRDWPPPPPQHLFVFVSVLFLMMVIWRLSLEAL